MKDKIRIGMVGVGQIGKHHLNNYQKDRGSRGGGHCRHR